MKGGIQAENIAFQYLQDNRGLPPLSLAVDPGKGLFLNGVSGCGKSTLARCLSGLIPHLYRGTFEGQVSLNGLNTRDEPLWRISERVGLVFQNPAFQMLTPTVEEEILFGLENLGLERDVMQQRLDKELERFDLVDLRQRSPHTLSGGEQQKVALASILAREPGVLVLDEPLSMLDTTAAVELVNLLADKMDEGTALVICEHRAGYLGGMPGLERMALNGTPTREGLLAGNQQPFPGMQAPFTLEVQNLGVDISGCSILRDLNFSLPSGQVVAFVGRNGAGKTTLFRALAGLQPFEGRLSVQKGEGTETPGFGMVFQNPDLQIFNGSVREEILYHLEDPDMALYSWLLEILGMARYENTPPLLISEGEKRRLALATALMRRPQHGILLDEPALGQDAGHKQILVQLMHAMAAAGYLVMFSTHDLELASQADTLLLMGPDGAAAQGPAAEVIADSRAWEQLGIVIPDWMDLACSR